MKTVFSGCAFDAFLTIILTSRSHNVNKAFVAGASSVVSILFVVTTSQVLVLPITSQLPVLLESCAIVEFVGCVVFSTLPVLLFGATWTHEFVFVLTCANLTQVMLIKCYLFKKILWICKKASLFII